MAAMCEVSIVGKLHSDNAGLDQLRLEVERSQAGVCVVEDHKVLASSDGESCVAPAAAARLAEALLKKPRDGEPPLAASVCLKVGPRRDSAKGQQGVGREKSVLLRRNSQMVKSYDRILTRDS